MPADPLSCQDSKMGKRTADKIDSNDQDFAMVDGYTDSLKNTIMKKIVTAEGKAEAFALLSVLDPSAPVVRETFLTSEFCSQHLYADLVSQDLATIHEASNTIKTWLNTASGEPSMEILRRMYALQVMPNLLEAAKNACAYISAYTEMQEQAREMVKDILVSILASIMILAENLEVCLGQINSSSTIDLLVLIYEKYQIMPDEVLAVASECLAVLTEDNEGFMERTEGIRLYSLLLNLPSNWTNTKALPLTLKSLLALSSLHGNEQDQVYEKSLDTICSLISSSSQDDEMMSACFETLANMLEGLDASCLNKDDLQMIMRVLEIVCRSLSTVNAGMVLGRGLGALTNLLVLCVDTAGENINSMIWNELVSVWMPKCDADEEAISGLVTVMRLLQLNLSKKSAKCTEDQLQLLVNIILPFKGIYSLSITVLFPLVNKDKLPTSLDQIVLESIASLNKADPEELEDLSALMDECFGESIDPLPIRLQNLVQPPETIQE